MLKSDVTGRLFGATALTTVVMFAVLNLQGSAPFIILWICIHAILAMSLRLVMLVGEVNLAMGAFYGVGAYCAAKFSLAGIPFLVAILLGTILAAIVGALFGSMALRASGAAFILVSFAFNEVLRMIYTKTEFLGGNSGLVGIFADQVVLAVVIVGFTGAIGCGLFLLERSKWGLFFSAVESKPLLAASIGLDPTRVRLVALTVSAAVAGAAGGLLAHYSSVIAPQDFSFMISITVLAFVMIGGRGYLVGAVLGAAVLTFISEELRVVGSYEPLIYGTALMVAMVFMPRGIVGLARTIFEKSKSLILAGRNSGGADAQA